MHPHHMHRRCRLFGVRVLRYGRSCLQPMPYLAMILLGSWFCRLLKKWIFAMDEGTTHKWHSLGWTMIRGTGEEMLKMFDALSVGGYHGGDAMAFILGFFLVLALVVLIGASIIILFASLIDVMDWLFMTNWGQTMILCLVVVILWFPCRWLFQQWRKRWSVATVLERELRLQIVNDDVQNCHVTTSTDIRKLILEFLDEEEQKQTKEGEIGLELEAPLLPPLVAP